MPRLTRLQLVMLSAAMISSCAGMLVRQQDLDAWVDIPVEALDTHSFFITVPMIRTRTESGIEIRNYANGRNFASCSATGSANLSGNWINSKSFSNCSSEWVGRNNLFYIKDGKVIEYAPSGRCYTDSSVQPQERYKRLRAASEAEMK